MAGNRPEDDVVQRGVLVDIGGVVIVTPFELLAGAERRHGLAEGSLGSRGPFAEEPDPELTRVAAGDLTERAYWAERARRAAPLLGTAPDTRSFMDVLFDAPEHELVRAETRALLQDLRDRPDVVVALFTNDVVDFHGREWVDSIATFRLADHLVDVSRHGTLKPHPQAYAVGLATLALPAARTALLDDQAVNCAGAATAGIHAVQFTVTTPHAGIAQLEDWLSGPGA